MAYRDADRLDCDAARRGVQWLQDSMHSDGSWGGELLCERRAGRRRPPRRGNGARRRGAVDLWPSGVAHERRRTIAELAD